MICFAIISYLCSSPQNKNFFNRFLHFPPSQCMALISSGVMELYTGNINSKKKFLQSFFRCRCFGDLNNARTKRFVKIMEKLKLLDFKLNF